MTNLLEHKKLQLSITLLTIGFFAISIWNIWQQHKYRKLEYDLKLNETKK